MTSRTLAETLDRLIEDFVSEGRFSVVTVAVADDETNLFARLKHDPKRFTPDIFDDDWSGPGLIKAGEVRILRVVVDSTGVGRALGRQGDYIYAYPST